LKIYDTYTKYHGKIDFRKIVPKHTPLFEIEQKKDFSRLTKSHVRKNSLQVLNLFTEKFEGRDNPIGEFKSILELSTRAPYCPCPFVLDTMMGVCSYSCIYCFTSLTISSLMTAFFDGENILAPRYASPEYVKNYLTEVLRARDSEPFERLPENDSCGSTTDIKSLKKASSQRIPLRFGTRSENFLPAEKIKGSALTALEVIKSFDYPLIINTKSDLILQEPYFKIISEMGKNVAIQVSVIHMDDNISKKLEPGAPSPTQRWEVLKTFNQIGINAMPRMEPCAEFLNADDEHLIRYFDKAKESCCKSFMGDLYHHTVSATEIQRMFNREGFDFDRMWEATAEYQILGSYSMEKAMYYAKKNGLKAGTFNFHSLPWMDSQVCCMVSDQFKNWNKYSAIHFMKNELIEGNKMGFTEFDEKYYGYELHGGIRKRLRQVWDYKIKNCFNFDFCEGVIPIGKDDDGHIIYKFDSSRIGEGYENIIKTWGDKNVEKTT